MLLVLTPGFESSCWCMEEARVMAERHNSVLPIFYDREPGSWSEDDLKSSFEELCREVPVERLLIPWIGGATRLEAFPT